jgi:two-component system response regulator FixJ
MISERSTIHLIDDEADIRESLQLFLAEEGLKVKTYASALNFLSNTDPELSGCIVTDVRMPGMSGIDFLSDTVVSALGLPVILITANADIPLAIHAMRLGAADLLEKPFRPEDLLATIRNTLSRTTKQDASVAQDPEESTARFASLSFREVEVLRLLMNGKPNKTIAQELGISPRTVEVHRASVMKKTQARSLSHLIRMFLAEEEFVAPLKTR